MSTFVLPDNPTYADWRDCFEIVEMRLSAWILTAPDGSQYLDPENTPGPLAKLYGEIVEVGLQHGWIERTEDVK